MQPAQSGQREAAAALARLPLDGPVRAGHAAQLTQGETGAQRP